MDFGFPADEVRPMSCDPYGPDRKDVYNIVRNDAMGNVSLTVLDNIDSLVMFEKWDELEVILNFLKDNKNTLFAQDSIVQVFEATIRSLGGLLSSHLLLTDVPKLGDKFPRYRLISENYDGFLLEMAHDLGQRLLPAFVTQSSIPLPRINLKKGLAPVPAKLQKENCISGATTPIVEFTLLSKLTGDPQFEFYAHRTFWKLWLFRLDIELLPMTIDPQTASFLDSITGIGASIDSFYEYAAKYSIIFDDNDMWTVFKRSYKALLTHLVQGGSSYDGTMIFANVNFQTGNLATTWIDSLGAFWLGVQVLTGQLTDAVKTHLVYLKLWDYFDLIPERWNHIPGTKSSIEHSIPLEWYPLRPEFIESTYYLYRATRDPMYLQIGARVLHLLSTRYKNTCGFSGIQDIRTGRLQNRMETFVMSETLKYLYLLFDAHDELFLHDTTIMGGKSWVFSTEAHPLWYDKRIEKKLSHFNPVEATENKGLLQSFMGRFRTSEPEEKSVVVAPLVEFPNGNIDISGDRFDQCERKPVFLQPNLLLKKFMSSFYYSMPYLFQADDQFSNTLTRPKYLRLDKNNIIELTRSFYRTYTSFDTILQCPRRQTTTKYDLFLGDRKGMAHTQVSTVKKSNDSLVMQNDLWVPYLDLVRFSFEKLEPGKIDGLNQDITEEYVESLNPDEYDGEFGVCHKSQKPSTNSALRLLKVNGVNVEPGLIVWTSDFEVDEKEENPVVDIGGDGRVRLQGSVIENLFVYDENTE